MEQLNSSVHEAQSHPWFANEQGSTCKHQSFAILQSAGAVVKVPQATKTSLKKLQ